METNQVLFNEHSMLKWILNEIDEVLDGQSIIGGCLHDNPRRWWR